jgi:sugar phosphate permease
MLGGAAAASTNAASGRVVAGWFTRSRRGLAMGIRQMAQPLGVTALAGGCRHRRRAVRRRDRSHPRRLRQ